MSDASLHEDNDTPNVSDSDIKRSDADTHAGIGDSVRQGIGRSPTEVGTEGAIQNAPKTPS